MAGIPDVGDAAPHFRLPSTEGTISLSDRLGERAVLLVFYPGDETPVCTKQLCDYRDNVSVFRDLGVDVLAVNPQPLASHERFARKHELPFPLLADTDKRVCRAYGALSLFGTAKRALVLIDPQGRIRWRRTDFPFFRRTADELREVIAAQHLETTREAPEERGRERARKSGKSGDVD
jgi:peroxiredoxin Q/BCP